MHTVIYIHLCNCIWCSRAPRNGHTPVLAPRAVSSAHQETAFQPGHRLPRASISPGHSPEGLLLLALPVAICHFLQPAWCQCQSWPPLKLLLPQQAELPSPSLLPPLGPPRWPTRRFQQSCRHPFQVGPAARTPDRPCVYLHWASRRASPSPATSGPSAGLIRCGSSVEGTEALDSGWAESALRPSELTARPWECRAQHREATGTVRALWGAGCRLHLR